MEQKKRNHLRLVANNEGKVPSGEDNAELDSVAAAIRPLPRDVAPSQEFLGELRMRLLQLEPGPKRRRSGDSRRAA